MCANGTILHGKKNKTFKGMLIIIMVVNLNKNYYILKYLNKHYFRHHDEPLI